MEHNTDSTTEHDAQAELIQRTVAVFGRAIAAKDWSTAREMWSWFRPLYAELFTRDPHLAHVEELLKQNEAFAGPSVGGIH